MLLFILLQNDRKNRQILFQYISCYSLSIWTAKKIEAKRVFQYISCYSLSKYDFWIARYPAKFQYISCYSLSFQRDHLHFQIQRFQYISCYSLSGTTRTEVSPYRSFNTSHVTLYRHKTLEGAAFVGFQYVSCYSLSIEQKAYEDGFTVFQYISCYSLSGRGCCCTSSRFVSIHLMLLFITMTKGVFSEFEGFNTSHVTLYRKCGSGVVYQPMVSIHLMLLFIRHDLDEKGIAYPFQYISCYSLSGHQAINACLTSAFQYISCYSLSRGFSALPWP